MARMCREPRRPVGRRAPGRCPGRQLVHQPRFIAARAAWRRPGGVATRGRFPRRLEPSHSPAGRLLGRCPIAMRQPALVRQLPGQPPARRGSSRLPQPPQPVAWRPPAPRPPAPRAAQMAVSMKSANTVGARAQRAGSKAAVRPSVSTRSVRAAAQAPFKAASSSAAAAAARPAARQAVVARAAATAGAAAVAGVDAKKINAKPVVVITGALPASAVHGSRPVVHPPAARWGGHGPWERCADARPPPRCCCCCPAQAPRPAWAWPPPLRWPRPATGTW